MKRIEDRKKGQFFRRRMPFKLFIRIPRSWGRATTGRANECGVNRLQETQKITSRRGARKETLIVVAQQTGTVRFLDGFFKIFWPPTCLALLYLLRDYEATVGKYLIDRYIYCRNIKLYLEYITEFGIISHGSTNRNIIIFVCTEKICNMLYFVYIQRRYAT